jgi:hypothetical protein
MTLLKSSQMPSNLEDAFLRQTKFKMLEVKLVTTTTNPMLKSIEENPTVLKISK